MALQTKSGFNHFNRTCRLVMLIPMLLISPTPSSRIPVIQKCLIGGGAEKGIIPIAGESYTGVTHPFLLEVALPWVDTARFPPCFG